MVYGCWTSIVFFILVVEISVKTYKLTIKMLRYNCAQSNLKMLIYKNDEGVIHFFINGLWAFHPILVTLFLVCFSKSMNFTKILRDSLFIFFFILPILPCKWKTSYRKSRHLSDEKPKTKLPKYEMSRACVHHITPFPPDFQTFL